MNAHPLPCPSSFPDHAAERAEARELRLEREVEQLVNGWLDNPKEFHDEWQWWPEEEHDECWRLMLEATQGGEIEKARLKRWLTNKGEAIVSRNRNYWRR